MVRPQGELGLSAGLIPGLVVGLGVMVLVSGLIYVYWMATGNRRRTKLMSDSRYQSAVAQYHGNWEAAKPERLAAAVATLTDLGIPAGQAEDNLRFLCGLNPSDRKP